MSLLKACFLPKRESVSLAQWGIWEVFSNKTSHRNIETRYCVEFFFHFILLKSLEKFMK